MSPHSRHLLPLFCAFLPLLIDPTSDAKAPRSSTAAVLPALDPAARSAGADESWWQTVSAQIARDEYHVSSTADGLQAPNRAQGLRTTFRAGGIEVAPRQEPGAGGPSWRFGWITTRWGREGELQTIESTVPSAEAEGVRVRYGRPGFDEWYENTPEGLEQGFTVHARPRGRGWLYLMGQLDRALHAELRDAGTIDLLDAHGACVLRYGELQVCDASGQSLTAQLAVQGEELAIQVDDRDAHYPITIDPLMTSPAWTAGGDQNSALFGASVKTAGDVNGDGYSDVIVGAYLYDNGETDEGRAFVYHGSAAGLNLAASWTAESNQVSARLGISAGTAGDVNGDGYSDVIVGAHYYDGGEANEGRAFVYHGSPGGLGPSPVWTAEGNQADAGFGYSVGTAGDVNGDSFSDVIVGAYFYDNGEADEGRAFVYHGSAAGLSLSPMWSAEGDQISAEFGVSVGTAGDVDGDGFSDIIVGAYFYDTGEGDEGRAYAARPPVLHFPLHGPPSRTSPALFSASRWERRGM